MSKKEPHPLHDKALAVKRSWPFIELCNNYKGGVLVIIVYEDKSHDMGRIFTQSAIEECIYYIQIKVEQQRQQLTLF